LKIAGFGAFTLFYFGVFLPWLISARDDLLLVVGFAALIAYPVLLFTSFKSEIKTLKTKMENL
jgi:hypothetical protein